MADPSAALSAGRTAAESLSWLLGWSYSSLWAVSFVPQILHSQKTRNMVGVSSDFIGLNVAGFLSYLSATLALLLNEQVRHQYAQRHDGYSPLVRVNDAAFAAWASLCALTQLAQAIQFRSTSNPVSKPTRWALVVIVLGVFSSFVATDLSRERWWRWLDFVNLLFYVKIFISLVKYVPQVSLNFRRKSTQGYRVENLFADLGGGLLSLAQLVLDAALQGDWSGITGHPAKLGIALIALVMDVILIGQWATYDKPLSKPDATARDEESPLLAGATERTALLSASQQQQQ